MLSHSLNNFILVFLTSLFSELIALGGGPNILNNSNISDKELLAQGGGLALVGSLGLISLFIFIGIFILISWIYALFTFNKKLD